MAEQSGEGFFNVNQGIHKDLQEGRELIRDHDESIKLLKDLIDFDISQAEHLEEGGETDRAEESRTRAREYSKA